MDVSMMPGRDEVLKVIELDLDEYDNKNCEDQRYGCTCINYEKCCGCLMQ